MMDNFKQTTAALQADVTRISNLLARLRPAAIDDYLCEIDMDEDEYARFLTDTHYTCPYYRNGDEYAVVRHQM